MGQSPSTLVTMVRDLAGALLILGSLVSLALAVTSPRFVNHLTDRAIWGLTVSGQSREAAPRFVLAFGGLAVILIIAGVLILIG